MRRFIAFLTKLLLKSRYRIKVSCNLKESPLRGALIMPNHPAEIDPVIVSTYLWGIASPRAVVTEPIFKMPVLHLVFKYIRAFPMPDMESGSGYYKRRRIQETLDTIVSSVERGENILIYPSGRLSVDGREILGGSSGAYTIIQKAKNARIVLVRTRGLWGSRFSKALTGGLRPDIGGAFLSSLKTLLKNFIFFVPKREVELSIQEFSAEELQGKSVLELNQFLEAWYADGLKEEASYIPNSFFSKRVLVPEAVPEVAEQIIELPEQIKSKVYEHLAKVSQRPISQIKPEAKLNEDLGLDSLAVAELLTWVHDEFDAHDLELAELTSVNAVLKAIAQGQQITSGSSGALTPPAWRKGLERRPQPQVQEFTSIAEAFISSAKRLHTHPACADPLAGVLNYNQVLLSSLVLSDHFRKLPGKYLGVLLPASCTSAMVIMAAQFANKIPVFLNWTAGERALQHAVESLSIEKIISAGAVLDVINHDLSILDEKFCLLEEIKRTTTWPLKLRAFFASLLPESLLLARLGIAQIKIEDTAVVLFTSGSEATPKGVPLSNRNLLSNIKGIAKIFEFNKEDVFFGFLPPFHSFGLTVTTLMPLISGIRVSFFSNPNESRKIASGCKTWDVSLLAGTPAFIRGILSAGSAQHFEKLRLLMSGADSLGGDVRELAKSLAPQALLLEGYGITECSPVVSAQRPHQISSGVGIPLPEVKVRIADLEAKSFLPDGERGLVLISGPSVFAGYLGNIADPFVQIENQHWYNSGDLGYFKDGSLILAGRLKRFVKVGGEMISLPALEKALIDKISKEQESPSIAIVDSEDAESQRPLLTLFSSDAALTKERAQEILKESGFPSLAKIHESRYLPELPLLGSGKIDTQSLKRMLTAS